MPSECPISCVMTKAAPKSRPERRRVRRPRRGDEGEKKPELVVGELLRHSRPAVGSSLRTVLQEALASDDGSAEPMLMVEGQLHFTFDPRTELETLASLARPLAKAGGPLGEDLDHIDALLMTAELLEALGMPSAIGMRYSPE